MMQENLTTKDRALNIALSGVDRLNEVITEFWDIFELECGNYNLNLGCVNILELINKQISEKEILIDQNKNLEFIFENNIENDCEVLCDYKKIINVVSNLLDNSIRYTDIGYIKIILTKNKKRIKGKKYITIEIEDTGIGILKEDRTKIFEKFIRGENAIKLKPNGSGLGLYLSNKIVEMHNSKLILEKANKKGSRFSFKLEVCEDDALYKVNKNQINLKSKIPTLKNIKILFFQNDKKTIEICSNIIKNNNYECFYTNKLTEAKKIILNEKPDIIFSGIIIYKQGKNRMVNTIAEQGYSLLEYRNKKKINIPFIFLTNLNTTRDRKKAIEMDVSEYISKIDFKVKDLENIINRNLQCYIKK
jgi:CheY-like chemotaxis protein